MNYKVYIIKPYNKYILTEPEQRILYKFNLYDNQYCLVETTLEWGKPVVSRPFQEQDDYGYTIYSTQQDAFNYIKQLKKIAHH